MCVWWLETCYEVQMCRWPPSTCSCAAPENCTILIETWMLDRCYNKKHEKKEQIKGFCSFWRSKIHLNSHGFIKESRIKKMCWFLRQNSLMTSGCLCTSVFLMNIRTCIPLYRWCDANMCYVHITFYVGTCICAAMFFLSWSMGRRFKVCIPICFFPELHP